MNVGRKSPTDPIPSATAALFRANCQHLVSLSTQRTCFQEILEPTVLYARRDVQFPEDVPIYS
jgi:hypothetical protein